MPPVKKGADMGKKEENLNGTVQEEVQETIQETVQVAKQVKQERFVELFNDGSEKCRYPLRVTINGIATKIPYGEPVQVSDDVYDVLENMKNQNRLTMKMINGLAESFAEGSK